MTLLAAAENPFFPHDLGGVASLRGFQPEGVADSLDPVRAPQHSKGIESGRIEQKVPH